MSQLLAVFSAVLLLAGNAFFVGAEFALISARRDRLDTLAAGSGRTALAARTVLRATGRLPQMLAASHRPLRSAVSITTRSAASMECEAAADRTTSAASLADSAPAACRADDLMAGVSMSSSVSTAVHSRSLARRFPCRMLRTLSCVTRLPPRYRVVDRDPSGSRSTVVR